MSERGGASNRALSSALARRELRDLISVTAGLNAYRPCLAVPLLWGGEGYGIFVIHKVSTQGSQSCLAANIHQCVVSARGSQYFQALPIVSLPVPTGLRSCGTCDSEELSSGLTTCALHCGPSLTLELLCGTTSNPFPLHDHIDGYLPAKHSDSVPTVPQP